MRERAAERAVGLGGRRARLRRARSRRAASCYAHPSLELTAVTARSDAGRRHDESTRATACRSSSRTFDPDAGRRAGRRRPGRLPAQGRGSGRQGAARARPEGGGPVRRLPARPGGLRALVPAPRGARAAGEAVYGLPEAHREEIARGRPGGGPRLQLDRRRCSPCCRCGRHRGRGRRHQDRRVGRRPRGHRGDPLRLRHRQRQPLQDRGPPPPRRAPAGAARASHFTFVPHCCRSTRA